MLWHDINGLFARANLHKKRLMSAGFGNQLMSGRSEILRCVSFTHHLFNLISINYIKCI